MYEIECALLCLNLTIDFLCVYYENQCGNDQTCQLKLCVCVREFLQLICETVCNLTVCVRVRVRVHIGVQTHTHTHTTLIQSVELENFQIASKTDSKPIVTTTRTTTKKNSS